MINAKVLVLAALGLWGATSFAHAQDTHPRVLLDDGANVTPPHAPLGSSGNPAHVIGTTTGSVSGFTPASTASAGRLTQFTVNTSDTASPNWPSAATGGAVLIVDNSGPVQGMYCNLLGAAATTSDKWIPPNSWFAFTVPASPPAALHCIAPGGSTTAEGLAGTGLPTGAGGGGSSAQGAAAPLSGAWPTMITDGTNGPAAVKPGNVSPSDSDAAVVVTESTNSNAAVEAGGNLANILTELGSLLNAIEAGTYTNNTGTYGSFSAVGGVGQSSELTPNTTGKPTTAVTDLAGKLINMPFSNRENMFRSSAYANSTSPVAFVPPSGNGSLKEYAWVNCFRSDNGSGPITVTFNDTVAGSGGNYNAGTEIVLPNLGGGGGVVDASPIPLVFAANTAGTMTVSAATTSVICNARGFYGY